MSCRKRAHQKTPSGPPGQPRTGKARRGEVEQVLAPLANLPASYQQIREGAAVSQSETG